MKILALAAFALAMASPLAATNAPPLVRAHYEITLQKGRSTWTVQSGGNLTSGVPITYDTGSYRVSLVAYLEPSGRYTLKVSVGSIPHGSGAVFVPDSRSFAGNMGFPLEFTTTLMGTTVKGAIMVAKVTQRTARAGR